MLRTWRGEAGHWDCVSRCEQLLVEICKYLWCPSFHADAACLKERSWPLVSVWCGPSETVHYPLSTDSSEWHYQPNGESLAIVISGWHCPLEGERLAIVTSWMMPSLKERGWPLCPAIDPAWPEEAKLGNMPFPVLLCLRKRETDPQAHTVPSHFQASWLSLMFFLTCSLQREFHFVLLSPVSSTVF